MFNVKECQFFERDFGVVSDLNNLGAMAQQYYKKPSSWAAVGIHLQAVTVPLKLDTTANGFYIATVAAQSVVITGTQKIFLIQSNDGSLVLTQITYRKRLLIITTGNIKNVRLFELILNNMEHIEELFNQYNLVELT